MTLSRWWIVISLALVVLAIGIVLWAMFSFSNKPSNSEAKSNIEPPPVINDDQGGTVGHVIMNGSSIYFIHEKDLPNEDLENIQWNELSSLKGHPTDYVLFGEPVEAINGQLTTGDKVKIWYSLILESHPAEIKILKIQKL